jgi:ubiquinone/menaquinone biosynthesis C-methylase UbiE
VDALETFKANQKAGWAHFAPLQAFTTAPAAQLVKFAGIAAGQRVLDVACGTGVVAVTAARVGAKVTGLDLTPELLTVARENAQIAGVDITWREGDVEALPFEPAAFDVVVSQFGHIFAPRPEVAVGEMLRVLEPGGTLAFSTWVPRHFSGRMFELVGRYMPPPPPGISPPGQWGDTDIVRERLGTAVRDVVFEHAFASSPTLSPQHHRTVTEKAAGPVLKLVESLSANDPERLAAFRHEYDALVSEYLVDNLVRQEFLMTRAVKNPS